MPSMFDKRVRWVAMLVVLLTTGTALAEAQELASTFDQLRVLVKRGDTVRVTDGAGRVMTGTIADLSASSLALLVAGTRHDLPASDIMTIQQRRPDSLSNGAKWGFAIGFVTGLLSSWEEVCTGADFECSYDYNVGLGLLGGALMGGIGAGIGVGIDAMISGMQTIYAKPAASSAVSVTLMLTRQRRGILLSFAF